MNIRQRRNEAQRKFNQEDRLYILSFPYFHLTKWYQPSQSVIGAFPPQLTYNFRLYSHKPIIGIVKPLKLLSPFLTVVISGDSTQPSSTPSTSRSSESRVHIKLKPLLFRPTSINPFMPPPPPVSRPQRGGGGSLARFSPPGWYSCTTVSNHQTQLHSSMYSWQ